jgi:hypothetical protein
MSSGEKILGTGLSTTQLDLSDEFDLENRGELKSVMPASSFS